MIITCILTSYLGGGGYHFKQFLYFLNKKQKINFLYSEDILEEC